MEFVPDLPRTLTQGNGADCPLQGRPLGVGSEWPHLWGQLAAAFLMRKGK